ncbi:MAG: VOC family protein [Chloroflexi bacterium]|nr:VOC family protein [Chloroflexota bacterium]
MRKITPHLWFDKEAKEAAQLYTSIFPNSRITNVTTIHNVPSPTGDSDIVSFELSGQPFMAISAGPDFKINPSVSFIVNFDPSRDQKARASIDAVWNKLSPGGTILMPLQEYPFSKHYGWLQDKYGLSWQLMLTNPQGEERPDMVPSLLFVGEVCGKTEEAIEFYLSIFRNSPFNSDRDGSKMGAMMRYGAGQEPEKAGTVMFADFKLAGTWLAAMDSAREHQFAFNEATSLLVPCETQEEIDYFWNKLSADPGAEQCGWLKDRYGLSWQVWPTVMGEMMADGTPEQIARVTKAFLPMKKFEIAKLEEAYAGK